MSPKSTSRDDHLIGSEIQFTFNSIILIKSSGRYWNRKTKFKFYRPSDSTNLIHSNLIHFNLIYSNSFLIWNSLKWLTHRDASEKGQLSISGIRKRVYQPQTNRSCTTGADKDPDDTSSWLRVCRVKDTACPVRRGTGPSWTSGRPLHASECPHRTSLKTRRRQNSFIYLHLCHSFV